MHQRPFLCIERRFIRGSGRNLNQHKPAKLPGLSAGFLLSAAVICRYAVWLINSASIIVQYSVPVLVVDEECVCGLSWYVGGENKSHCFEASSRTLSFSLLEAGISCPKYRLSTSFCWPLNTCQSLPPPAAPSDEVNRLLIPAMPFDPLRMKASAPFASAVAASSALPDACCASLSTSWLVAAVVGV